jgi:hypothetical protein
MRSRSDRIRGNLRCISISDIHLFILSDEGLRWTQAFFLWLRRQTIRGNAYPAKTDTHHPEMNYPGASSVASLFFSPPKSPPQGDFATRFPLRGN